MFWLLQTLFSAPCTLEVGGVPETFSLFHLSLVVFQEDLFQTPGLQEELQSIIDCLDTSIPDSIRIL